MAWLQGFAEKSAAHIHEPAVQEFQTAMLDMWGVTPQTKGYRRYVRMLADWFAAIDRDGSGEIDFGEFQAWYRASITDARAAGVL